MKFLAFILLIISSSAFAVAPTEETQLLINSNLNQLVEVAVISLLTICIILGFLAGQQR